MEINAFSPTQGWPGTIIKIRGLGFSSDRDQNIVEIEGVPALVIEAYPDQLLVLAGEDTVGGRISVTIGNVSAMSDQDFRLLPYPEPDDATQPGVPRFFHGPMMGTPKPHQRDQPVLMLFTYPTDHNPGAPVARAALRSGGIVRSNEANRYWHEATYGTTTWKMQYSEWLPLPEKLRTYFWQPEDIEYARSRLVYDTHRALQYDNGRIFNGSEGGCIPVSHPNPTSYAYHLGLDTAGAKATTLHLEGNRLYAGTNHGRLYAYDVTNVNAPFQLGFLDLANSSIMAMDRQGANLLVAGRNGRIHWIDISNPAAMRLDVTLDTTAGSATAVKVAAGRGYICASAKLHVYDLTGVTPSHLDTFNFAEWTTGVDVSGSRCVVTTDGDGMHVYEVTATGLAAKARFSEVLRLRAVDLVGATAYLAANDAGLLIVDISSMAAPMKRGQLITKKPCFNVVVNGSEALLAVGLIDLLSVAANNIAAPTTNHGEQSESHGIPLAALRGGLQSAQNERGKVKDHNRLFLDALHAWLALPGNSQFDLDTFVGFIVVVSDAAASGPIRAQSWPALNSLSFFGQYLNFARAKGAIYISANEPASVIAHEIGHWLGMSDLYSEKFADGSVVNGTAHAWALMGNGPMALFTAYHIQEKLSVYEAANPNNLKVVDFAWSPTSNVDKLLYIAAHDLAQAVTPNEIHILRLRVAEGLYYYVEVRQKPTGALFDQSLPALPAGMPGAVVVTRVAQEKALSNTYERQVMLHGVLVPGEQAVDAARNLIVRVERVVRERPLLYEVRLLWNQPIAGDPNGTFDTTIKPWSTETWESEDIWVESPRNSPPGPGHQYDFFEGNDRTVPRLSGDKPWVRHENQIIARIRNTGPQKVTEVYVSCYVTSPPGIGDNGDWVVLETKQIPSLAGNSETYINFEWTPNVGEHTCLSISILPQIGEIATNNNFGQENIAHFESTASSSHQPVILEAAVRSPFTIWRKVDLLVRDLPLGWHAVIDKAWVWLEGKGSRPVRAVIWTDRDSAAGEEQDIPALALPRVEGWTNHDHLVVPIGGILAPVRAVKRVGLDINSEPGGDRIIIYGCLTLPVSGVTITLEVLSETGQKWYFYGVTNAQGCYNIDSANDGILFEPGLYAAQTFANISSETGEAESKMLEIEI